MAREKLKVVIVGGGIAGLSLANMLEAAGIDYVLLEAYKDIAPQAGASIGLFPNGLRILDQIGLYESIRSIWEDHPMSSATRDSTGRIICNSPQMGDHLEQRHGYPFIFIDRKDLLRLLFENLKYKERIHVSKQVEKVTMSETSVQVLTRDGESFAGTVLVGADGIHSCIRDEMWRIGEEAQPGAFLKDRQHPASCNYKCIFGISIREHRLESNHFVCGDGHSYLISPGPNRRAYWFLFVRNTATQRGDEIPQYTKDEERQLASEHMTDPITKDFTFGDLYKSSLSSTLTPLVEHVFQRWHFGRIITIGDSAHKHNPIAGQGGMSAIESAAAFVNALTTIQNKTTDLTNNDFDALFEKVRMTRYERVRKLIKGANDQQRLLANDHVLSFLVPYFLGYFGGLEHDLWHLRKRVVGAIKLDNITVPKRPRTIPFADEMPMGGNRRRRRMNKAVFVGIMLLVLIIVWTAFLDSWQWDARGILFH